MESTFVYMLVSLQILRPYKKFKKSTDLKSLLKKEESAIFCGVIQ